MFAKNKLKFSLVTTSSIRENFIMLASYNLVCIMHEHCSLTWHGAWMNEVAEHGVATVWM